ncbi:MAG: dTMP kinase [bacterium]
MGGEVKERQACGQHSGVFITFEGGEGSGKTTQIQHLHSWLQEKGLEVLITREPGGTQIGEAIRALLLSKELPAMHADTELLLMFAARAEHVQKVIVPALKQGKIVISDRFTDASFAYQGGGRGMPLARIAHLRDWVQQGLEPDVTFLLDLPIEEGMKRARARAELDRFESQDMEFFERVRQAYLQLARQESERVQCIDASQDIASVQRLIQEKLVALLGISID